MATHEGSAALSFSTNLLELGTQAEATLGFSVDLTPATLSTFEESLLLDIRTNVVPQGGQANANASPQIGGTLTEVEGKLQHTQPYRIPNLVASVPEDLLNQALNAVGVPLDKSPHPTISGIHVISRVCRFQLEGDQADPTVGICDVTWGLPADDLEGDGGVSGKGRLTLTPSAFSETIWEDRDGNTMVINYRATTGGPLFFRTVSAQIQRLTWTATLTLDFDTPQYADMKLASQINSEVYGVFGKRELLFMGTPLQETDEGKFRHGYQMMYNPTGWKLRSSIFVSGLIPGDATTVFDDDATPPQPGGLGIFDIYQEFDFNNLPVAFP